MWERFSVGLLVRFSYGIGLFVVSMGVREVVLHVAVARRKSSAGREQKRTAGEISRG